jgi:hypothetical protein
LELADFQLKAVNGLAECWNDILDDLEVMDEVIPHLNAAEGLVFQLRT